MALLWASLTAACGGGGGGGELGEDLGSVEDGQTVGMLETTASTLDEVTLRATIPVPKGTFPRADGKIPLQVGDFDGSIARTQVEIVSRYPRAADGADVVEVIARVNEPPGSVPGSTQLSYPVVFLPFDGPAGPGTPGLEDLRNGPRTLPARVRDFLLLPDGIEIRAFDCFDNLYVSRPLDGSGAFELQRYGDVHTQLRVSQTMLPEPELPGPTGTLPHLLGVQAYLSTQTREPVVGLDLRIHNAHVGLDQADPTDDPLGKVYFRRIEISIPSGWYLDQAAHDPFFGTPVVQGGRRIYPLVDENPDGTMHVMRWQGQFHRRLALVPTDQGGRATALLRQLGQAFCVRGTDPASGQKYWSWWNPQTARYFPQSVPLPSLEHIGRASVRANLRGERLGLLNTLATGGSTGGSYPIPFGVMGWGHAYGVPNGGMTSGAEIHVSDGIRVAESASRAGYQHFQLVHRMHSTRMPTALYRADGEPSSVEDWLIVQAQGEDYVPFIHFGQPVFQNQDPMGLGQAPQFQIDHVTGQGLQPGYEGLHMGYAPHDFYHYIRYTRSPKVLAWLGNDALAKDDLRMAAENYHLAYHQHRNDPFGSWQSNGLYSSLAFVQDYPNWGLSYGRGEAWGLDAMVAAYSLADPAWRSAKRHWFELVAGLVNDGIATCSGFIEAAYSNKVGHNIYRGRQTIEHAITDNALKGLLETVFRGEDTGHTAMVQDLVRDSTYAGISTMAWFPGEPAPWSYTAVAPLDLDLPIFCSLADIPADGFVPTHESYQNWSSFAYGYDATGDAAFLQKAAQQAGGGALLFELEQAGDDNIPNQAALLSLAQRLNGDF